MENDRSDEVKRPISEHHAWLVGYIADLRRNPNRFAEEIHELERIEEYIVRPTRAENAQVAEPVAPEVLSNLLQCSLKPDEISGPARERRAWELVLWFNRYYQGHANPKWLQAHAAELAYYVATSPPAPQAEVTGIVVTDEMVEAAARVLVPVWYGGFEDQTQDNMTGGWFHPPGTPNDRARNTARAALVAALSIGEGGR